MKPKQPLSKILSAYQPRPGNSFYQRMESAPWNQPEANMARHQRGPIQFRWIYAAAFFLLFVILAAAIPPVRAAVSAWLGLSVAPSNQVPAQSLTLVAVTPPTPTATPTANPTQSSAVASATAAPAQTQPPAETEIPPEISQLSPQAGWNILVPSQLPDGYQFQSAYFNTNQQLVVLTYLATQPLPGAADPTLTATHTITLLQAQKNDFVPMQVAPATNVEDVRVNGQPAVYAVGAWDTEFVPDDKDPNGGKMVSTWRNDLSVQNLYWQVGKIFLVIVTDDNSLSKQQLIDLAASISGPK